MTNPKCKMSQQIDCANSTMNDIVREMYIPQEISVNLCLPELTTDFDTFDLL